MKNHNHNTPNQFPISNQRFRFEYKGWAFHLETRCLRIRKFRIWIRQSLKSKSIWVHICFNLFLLFMPALSQIELYAFIVATACIFGRSWQMFTFYQIFILNGERLKSSQRDISNTKEIWIENKKWIETTINLYANNKYTYIG